MASARGVRAGAAFVELYANDNKLVRGLRRAQRRLRAFSASVRDVGMRMARMDALFALPFVAGVKVTFASSRLRYPIFQQAVTP